MCTAKSVSYKPPPAIEDPPGLEVPPSLEDPIGNDDVSDILEDAVFYYGISSNPISSMCSYVFHAENARALVYFSFD